MNRRTDYTDPRARALITNSWLANSFALLMVLVLGAMLLGSRGVFQWIEWSATAAIATAAAAAQLLVQLARLIEARTLAEWRRLEFAQRQVAPVSPAAPLPPRRPGVRPELLPQQPVALRDCPDSGVRTVAGAHTPPMGAGHSPSGTVRTPESGHRTVAAGSETGGPRP